MKIAFYAPLKPPSHPIPSGDRAVARLILAALAQAGHETELASRLRSRDGSGDPARQRDIESIGRHMARRLARRYRARPEAERPQLWLTYHLYYKAPDWIGPAVADALGIPYVVLEASHAPKRANGPWAIGHAAAAAAIRRADAVIQLNPADLDCVRPLLDDPTRLALIKPFLDGAPYRAAGGTRAKHRARLAGRLGLDPAKPWLLAVGMMRAGDKLASYRLLADALGWLQRTEWQLVVVGDGDAKAAVTAALAPLGSERLRYAGQVARAALPEFYAAADLLVWPAIGEAYGMALLEAQATGLPVVAGDVGGVSSIVADGRTGRLVPADDAPQFAMAVDALLADLPARRRMAQAAAEKARAEHDIGVAAAAIDAVLQGLAAPIGQPRALP